MMQVETTASQNITPPRITTAERRGITLPMMTFSSPRRGTGLLRSASLNSSPPRRPPSLYSRVRAGSSSSLRLRKVPKFISGTGVGLGSGLAGRPNTNANVVADSNKTTTNNHTPSPPKRTRSSVSAAKLGFGNLMGSLKNINFGVLSGKARRIAEMRGRERARAKSDEQMDARLISPLRIEAGVGAGEKGFRAQQDESEGTFTGTSSVSYRLWETDEDGDMTTATPLLTSHSADMPMSANSFGDVGMGSPSPVDCQFAFVPSHGDTNNSGSTIDDPFLTPQHSAISVDSHSRMGVCPPSSPLSSLTNTPERPRKFSTAMAMERSRNKAIQLLGAEASGVVEAQYGKPLKN